MANLAECSSDDEDAFESMDPKAIDKKAERKRDNLRVQQKQYGELIHEFGDCMKKGEFEKVARYIVRNTLCLSEARVTGETH